MITEKEGKVVKGLGGLYDVRVVHDGTVELLSCRAKGNLKRDEEKVLIGDNVRISIDTDTPDSVVISEILTRRNALVRPPVANLDYIFIVFASAKPSPVLETVDKLISIAEYNSIVPVIVITKSDVAAAEEYREIYELAGFPVFVTSSESGEGIDELREYVSAHLKDGRIAAFAGASGVGKSTLMNSLFPSLALATAEISRKIQRGRHTTRHVELFALSDDASCGFLADTPGFSLIDFARFDFMPDEALISTFRDIVSYVGQCRYADCAHVGEGADECAVARAAAGGKIAPSRLASYRSIYTVLKNKNKYE